MSGNYGKIHNNPEVADNNPEKQLDTEGYKGLRTPPGEAPRGLFRGGGGAGFGPAFSAQGARQHRPSGGHRPGSRRAASPTGGTCRRGPGPLPAPAPADARHAAGPAGQSGAGGECSGPAGRSLCPAARPRGAGARRGRGEGAPLRASPRPSAPLRTDRRAKLGPGPRRRRARGRHRCAPPAPAYLRSLGPPFYFLNHAHNASRGRTASTYSGPRRLAHAPIAGRLVAVRRMRGWLGRAAGAGAGGAAHARGAGPVP